MVQTFNDLRDELKELGGKDDPEYAHGRADDILLEILKLVLNEDAYNSINKAYKDIEKWYA